MRLFRHSDNNFKIPYRKNKKNEKNKISIFVFIYIRLSIFLSEMSEMSEMTLVSIKRKLTGDLLWNLDKISVFFKFEHHTTDPSAIYFDFPF